MLLLGQFNYGKRGILDISHTRLFTFSSLRALFEQAGFEVLRTQGIRAPYPLAIGNNLTSKFLLSLNTALIRISRGLFSYQIFCEVRCSPSLSHLLNEAKATADKKLKRQLAA